MEDIRTNRQKIQVFNVLGFLVTLTLSAQQLTGSSASLCDQWRMTDRKLEKCVLTEIKAMGTLLQIINMTLQVQIIISLVLNAPK